MKKHFYREINSGETPIEEAVEIMEGTMRDNCAQDMNNRLGGPCESRLQAPKLGEVAVAVNYNQEMAERLEKAVEELWSRLHPILGVQPDSGSGCPKSSEQSCPLAHRLLEIGDSVSASASKLVEILERLEV
jgi:hypothetical protein